LSILPSIPAAAPTPAPTLKGGATRTKPAQAGLRWGWTFAVLPLIVSVPAQANTEVFTTNVATNVAQALPPPVLPSPQPVPAPQPLPPLEDLLPEPGTGETPPELNIPGRIRVDRFEVVGSTVFSEEELQAVLAPFAGRDLLFTELLEAQKAIGDLYINNGYITSGAVIEPQSMQNGVVIIRAIEGRVSDIEITGLGRLKPSYVRGRLRLAAKTPLNRNRLLNTLQLLQLNPLIERLSVELGAGIRPGVSTLTVDISEAPAMGAFLGYDNQRSPSVGTDRRIVGLSHGNLLGFGDRANISYINTDGSNALDDASYTLPINPRNGTITLRYRNSDSDIIEEPFNELDIESKFRSYEISYRQPLRETPTSLFALGLSAVRLESENSLLGEPFPLSAGADDDGQIRVSALRFFQELTQRSARDVFAMRSQFSLGIGSFDATVNSEPPDSRFFAWRGQGQYLRILAPDTILLLRSDIQLATRPLLALEQFSLGGLSSVRGYRQDFLLADNGIFSSAEVRFPIARISEWQTVLQFTPFVDFGYVWNDSESQTEITKHSLLSIGTGLRLQVSDKLTAELNWGIPLVDVKKQGSTWQENGVYFRIEYRP